MESEYRWKFAVEGTGDGLWDWNVVEGTTFYSHRWKEMLGYADEEIAATPDEFELTTPSRRRRRMCSLPSTSA